MAATALAVVRSLGPAPAGKQPNQRFIAHLDARVIMVPCMTLSVQGSRVDGKQ
jgi:hypothetical protein